MSYNISYRIIDNKTKKVLFKNNNTSCFAEFLNTNALPPEFKKGRSIQVYRALDTIELTSQEIETYLKLLKKSNYKVSTNIIKKSDLNENYPHRALFSDDNLEFTLNFNNYISKQHLKLALYLVRFTFEAKSHELVREALKFIDNNPKCPILEAIRICSGYGNKFYDTGHSLFSSGVKTKPITKKLYNSIFSDEPYRGNELLTLENKISAQSYGYLDKNSSYKEHLDYFKVELDEV